MLVFSKQVWEINYLGSVIDTESMSQKFLTRIELAKNILQTVYKVIRHLKIILETNTRLVWNIKYILILFQICRISSSFFYKVIDKERMIPYLVK